MKRTLLAAFLLAATSAVFAADTDFVIPAAARIGGVGGSQWQSEVTLYNGSTSTMALTLTFHNADGTRPSFDLNLLPGTTTSLPDAVSAFNLEAGTGGIAIDVKDDSLVGQLAVSSRTFNISPAGEFGQDIAPVTPSQALTDGATGVLTGPSNVAQTRFNFGIYTLADTTVNWRLTRKDGTLVNQLQEVYRAGTQIQYNRGVETFFGATAENNDAILADIVSGSAVLFGSAVDNSTGDPSFVPASTTRIPADVEFLGIDRDTNGTVDIQAHNGALDQPVVVAHAFYPTFFRIAVAQKEGKPVTFQIVGSVPDARLADDLGTIEWDPNGLLAGTSGTLTVRVSDGTHTIDVLIPVLFR